MSIRPEFAVIAGPNGAGKSKLSSYYIHCDSFDGDLLALNLRKEHPEWQEHWISGTVAGELQRQRITQYLYGKILLLKRIFPMT